MKKISMTDLGAGSGTAAAIVEGESFRITDRGKAIATLRPHRQSDKGQETSCSELYGHVGRHVDKVQDGKLVVVLRKGKPFATLCKYPMPRAKQPRTKRRAKQSAKPPPQAIAPTEAGKPVPERHHASVELLNLAAKLPAGLDLELMTRGYALLEAGKLEKGLHLLELLDEGKLGEALAGLKPLMD